MVGRRQQACSALIPRWLLHLKGVEFRKGVRLVHVFVPHLEVCLPLVHQQGLESRFSRLDLRSEFFEQEVILSNRLQQPNMLDAEVLFFYMLLVRYSKLSRGEAFRYL